MANAIIARKQGDDYQARFFWLLACGLFRDHTRVERIGYDLDLTLAARAFDDVAIYYKAPIPDGRGGSITAEYFQVKFHVDHNGAFTWESFTDPKFINATSVSLLQRLRAAQERHAPNGEGAHFVVVSNWHIDHSNPLAKLVSQTDGHIRLGVLFDGTTDQSAMGKIRAAWKSHLGLTSDEVLKQVLSPLRLHANFHGLSALNARLMENLSSVGMIPVPADERVSPYDDLIWKVRAEGKSVFTRDEIERLCASNNLWRGRVVAEESDVTVCLRSFIRWAENLEDETEHLLCFLGHFDGRAIKDRAKWNSAVYPELSKFLTQTMRKQRTYKLQIDAHSSIAFAAGYCLDSKCGSKVIPVQKTLQGKTIWDPFSNDVMPYPEWNWSEIRVSTTGNDVALALCATHDVCEDVQLFVERELPEVKRVLILKAPQLGPMAIRDGAHALGLAQSLALYLKKNRTLEERAGRLHIFAAAPNALMFFLGQHARAYGPVTLYEFEFDLNTPGGYQPSFSFPCPAASGI